MTQWRAGYDRDLCSPSPHKYLIDGLIPDQFWGQAPKIANLPGYGEEGRAIERERVLCFGILFPSELKES
jgi:hypothetical protein